MLEGFDLDNAHMLYDFGLMKGTIKQLSLSSVGIVLGAERARQIIGEEFDLSIWI